LRTLAALALLSSLLFTGACLDDPDSDQGAAPSYPAATATGAEYPADSFSDDLIGEQNRHQLPGQVPFDRLEQFSVTRPEHAPAPDIDTGVLARQTGVAQAGQPLDLPATDDLVRAARARLEMFERANLMHR